MHAPASLPASLHIRPLAVARLAILAVAGLMAIAWVPAVAAEATPRRPNIVIILADDLGYGDLACYGHPSFKTPHLDRMAAEGAKLTQFNCPAAFCAPTRAALLTGRYPFRCGMPRNPAPHGRNGEADLHLPESEVTLPQLLARAGYATSMVGKWHLGHARPEWLPARRGFDEYFGIPYSNDMRPVYCLEGDRRVEYPVVQATFTQRCTTRAIDFMERCHAQSRPFFLYFAHTLVHKPLVAAEEFYKKSGAGLYGDAVAELDWSVGQVLAKLEDLGIDGDTFVVFTSDNGPWFGGSSGGLRGMKGSSYEGGWRVPCIARWPGRIPEGTVNKELAVTMDLFATALEAAGVEPPADLVVDGRDIMPVLAAAAPSPHTAVFGTLGPGLRTVRDGRWKLHVQPPADTLRGRAIATGPDGVTILAPFEQPQADQYPGRDGGDEPRPMQLFDLQADPGEQHDVVAAHPAEVQRLKQLFDAMLAQVPAGAAAVPAAPPRRKGPAAAP